MALGGCEFLLTSQFNLWYNLIGTHWTSRSKAESVNLAGVFSRSRHRLRRFSLLMGITAGGRPRGETFFTAHLASHSKMMRDVSSSSVTLTALRPSRVSSAGGQARRRDGSASTSILACRSPRSTRREIQFSRATHGKVIPQTARPRCAR